jgi:hypothetical protein
LWHQNSYLTDFRVWQYTWSTANWGSSPSLEPCYLVFTGPSSYRNSWLPTWLMSFQPMRKSRCVTQTSIHITLLGWLRFPALNHISAPLLNKVKFFSASSSVSLSALLHRGTRKPVCCLLATGVVNVTEARQVRSPHGIFLLVIETFYRGRVWFSQLSVFWRNFVCSRIETKTENMGERWELKCNQILIWISGSVWSHPRAN